MISDQHARQSALDPTRSFIVQAPAGSGKTGLLVYRLLTLLARVEQPQAVLAITFTRKATAEMRERLVALLYKAKRGEISNDSFEQQGIDLAHEVLKQDARYGWRLLETPHQLSISTIDAFCTRLSGSMPWLSRLGDRPRPSDDASKHYVVAVESVLRELIKANSPLAPSLNLVMTELDYNYRKARSLFTTMLAKRDQWLRHLFGQNLAALRDDIEQAWQQLIDEHIAQLEILLSDQDLAEMVSLGQHAATNFEQQGKQSILSCLQNVDSKPGTIEHWQALAQLCLTNDGAWRKRITKTEGFISKQPQAEAIKDLLAGLADQPEIAEALHQLRGLPSPHYQDSDWQQLLALEAVLKTLAAELQLRFRATGECDYSEVTQRANFALNELGATDLSVRLDADIQHILVDEIQDTSYGQIDLLKKLTQSWHQDRTLFLVGDPMQSIYRFREAEVSLFLQLANNTTTQLLPQIKIEYLSLKQNFRSSSTLVSWFNSTFSEGFPKKNDVLNGAVSYVAASSSKSGVDAPVTAVLASSKQSEAELVCEQIVASIDTLPENAQVALLVRSRSQLNYLLPAIHASGIDYMGIDIQLLKNMPAVKDTVSLAKAICRSDDHVALMSVLRAPWLALNLHQLHDLSRCQKESNGLNLIETLAAKIDSIVINDVAKKLQIERFVSIMRQARSEYQQVGLAQVCRWAWRSLGGRESLMGVSEKNIEMVFNMIASLEQGNDLPSLEALDEALEGLFAQPTADSDKAKLVISTMHKSKGLQYHTVILPGLGNSAKADSKDLMMWAESQNKQGKPQLYLAPLLAEHDAGQHFKFLRALEAKRSQYESASLLYVAATRAEQRLIISANLKPDKHNEERPQSPIKSSLLACIWPAVKDSFQYVKKVEPITDQFDALNQTLQRLPSSYAPVFAPPIELHSQDQLTASDTRDVSELEFEWATEMATAVGLILHSMFEYHAHDILNLTISKELEKRWRKELQAMRVPFTKIDQAVARIVTAIENVQQDSDARFIFKNYPDAENEMSISAFENGQVKPYRLDRTFTDESGTRWIVDYKSTVSRHPDPAAFAEQQVEQRHKSQLEYYGQLFRQLNQASGLTQTIRLAVYFPLLKQLVSWPLPTAK